MFLEYLTICFTNWLVCIANPCETITVKPGMIGFWSIFQPERFSGLDLGLFLGGGFHVRLHSSSIMTWSPSCHARQWTRISVNFLSLGNRANLLYVRCNGRIKGTTIKHTIIHHSHHLHQ